MQVWVLVISPRYIKGNIQVFEISHRSIQDTQIPEQKSFSGNLDHMDKLN